jgi:2-succinyl-5-enolpyruvyl-6-hydroxy-3-cyclohexene-1-carboxylate synthase/2-succinyl-6-hydroxy-2,4-cyclohexadiene-1-carboxylate synthase
MPPPSCLALHGFTGGGADFAPLVQALPGLAWRTPDLPGHAPDPATPGAPGDDCRLAAGIQYLDTLPPAPPEILLGYSLGGRLALRCALARPSRWAALVLIATSPGLADPSERAARQAADEKLAAEILAGSIPAFLDQWQRRPLIATQARLPADWRAAMQTRRLRLRSAGLAASLRQFGQGALYPVWDRLPELRLPVLIVAGAEDPAYIAHAQAMRQRLPSAEFLLVPGAGHLAHLENLPAFAAGLRDFFRRYGLLSAAP